MRQAYGVGDDRLRNSRASRLTRLNVLSRVLAILTFAMSSLLAWQTKPFTNADVLEMVKAEFGEETILEAIRTNEPAYDTSAEALKALKSSGVSEKIIMAILAAGRARRGSSAPSNASDGLPSEVGVYVLKNDKYVPLEIEPAHWRTRAFGSVTTSGMVSRTTLKAEMETLGSRVQLSGRPEFLLVCPEGVTATEYHLVRAEENKKKREFRAEFRILEGGFHVAAGGTSKTRVAFDAEKIAAREFKLKVPELAKGEYAFLPPSQGLEGKLYTFGLQ